jgi:hypothetical protein
MAFEPNTQAKSKDDSWKAAGFLNFFLPRADGQGKLGAIALKASDADVSNLVEWLEKDPGNAQKLLSKLQITYGSNKKKPGNGFQLPE